MKMWSGRFAEQNAKEVDIFNNSLHFDKVLYKYDIKGSIAHVKMLSKQGIITKEDEIKLVEALENLMKDIDDGKVTFNEEYEDIHMAVESILTDRIGDSAKRIHTCRSRNDQVALDMKMYVKAEIMEVMGLVKNLIFTLLEIAKDNTKTIMPGYTHMQRAQTVTFAHHLCAYVEMFRRDMDRLKDTYKRTNVMPLGAGALACSTFDIDRDYVASLLDFDSITLNSLDTVSDRDYVIELLDDLAIIMMHLSRFSEEIIYWASDEFKFITVSDKYSTGSSMMPQKKNPDVAELIRGKTGRVYGNLMAMLTVMKGLPLAYNKDMQEDKESTFDSVDTVKQCLSIFTGMIDTITVNKDVLKEACVNSFMNATDVAEYLVKKGCPFRDAHFVVGNLVGKCVRENKFLQDLTLDEFREQNELFEDDIYEVLHVTTGINKKNMTASPKEDIVKKYIEKILDEIK
ncbi:argininosuccinate lyase [Anaerofustis sp. NSJ-163]|uniref:argininosuccinate lyase n=1 Tax=Anaerofustis sp. NSJ-163 TaxID=2944391 RepID=UPI00209C1E11|nr:argininosuccinate lyase [Anaerofustis sp. NSJ-163]MCO8193219.1 argininosuccinate lyase [Anaerofustis sp. NSJ-163]